MRIDAPAGSRDRREGDHSLVRPSSSLSSIEPGLLLSAPTLGDPNFEGTVVLLGLHEHAGSLGWIVNGEPLVDAATIVRSTRIVGATAVLPSGFDRAALRGGPVSPESVWILYRRALGDIPLTGSILVGDDIGITAAEEALRTLIAGGGPSDYWLLVGYAGWGPEQLTGEIAAGAWLPATADADLIFGGERSAMWKRAYEKAIGTIPTAFVTGNRGSA
jgi:putative transcriptional regulator